MINSTAEISKVMIKGNPYKKNSRGTYSDSEDEGQAEGPSGDANEMSDLDKLLN